MQLTNIQALLYTLRKRVPKGFCGCSHRRTPFGFHVEPLCGKASTWEPKRSYLEPKWVIQRVLLGDSQRTLVGSKINQSIKCIYKALFTSADVTKCYTEPHPKTPNSKQFRRRSTVARKNSGQSSSGCAGWSVLGRVFLL